jgi:hypothetical protein
LLGIHHSNKHPKDEKASVKGPHFREKRRRRERERDKMSR